jgi:hypothetical protein
VKPTELSPKTPRIETGVCATLRACLPFAGIGTRFAALTAAGLVAVVAGMLLLAPFSLGVSSGGPPRFTEIRRKEVFSTRVSIEPNIDTESLATKWTAEYGTSPNGPWTLVDSGEETQREAEGSHDYQVQIGAIDAGSSGVEFLRRLTPGTPYYARFVVENKDGEAIETVPFTTLPVEKPRVDVLEPDDELTDTTAGLKAKVDIEGALTAYSFEYSLPEGGHAPAENSPSWAPIATGTITVAEEYANVKAQLAKLKPETTYYVRLIASNEKGKTVQTHTREAYGEFESIESREPFTFTTLTAKPASSSLEVRNVTADSAFVKTYVAPHGSETEARLEYATSAEGPWSLVPGSTLTISQMEAEATPYSAGGADAIGVRLAGLKASATYYVRSFTENKCAEGCGSATSGISNFETSGAPKTTTFATHWLVGESLQLLGSVNPSSVATSAEQAIAVEGAPTGGTFTLTFKGHSTSPIGYNASAEAVQQALSELPGEFGLRVEGPDGGPYTVFFGGGNGEKSEPLMEADGSGLTPSSRVTVTTTQQGGVGYDTHYHFQYVSQRSFEEHGWGGAEETASVDLGSGDTPHNVGADLPTLSPGETYRYRTVAVNTAPGTSPVEGAEQTLIVPAEPSGGGGSSCPNEVFRVGLSAHLPDCRAYEQLTPVDKEGAEEPFHYLGGIETAVLVGEDGEHAVLEAEPVDYGTGSGMGQSPYLFSRREGGGWSLTAGSPSLEMGIHNVIPQLYSANLTQIAFESAYAPSTFSESPDAEYEIGPIGGPYTTVASVPYKDAQQAGGEGNGWVAANGDFSKLVLETQDRTLAGEEPTPTKSGSDLYEYTPGEGLRQLNVTGEGSEAVTIGSCGANVAHGQEEGAQYHVFSGPHSISGDGSRVFFEAVPGKNCSEPHNLYMRVNGTETIDIGAYKLLGANVEGTRLLLEGAGGELLGYNTETQTVEHQSSGEVASASELRSLGIPARTEPQGANAFFHPRYTYWGANASNAENGQVYRYDSAEHLLECISCASSFDPEPKQPAFLGSVDGQPFVNGGEPVPTYVSANGEFAFFTTPAALVPQDVDGEIPIEPGDNHGVNYEYGDIGNTTSPSSDIYEWRASGVDGCAQIQGCLALITDGRGGYLNLLLGTADEGRDVIFYSRSTLSPLDPGAEGSIGEGNIYDARIDGGDTPRPPRPVECEADACSNPPSAPNDSTPSSLTFTGNGNVPQSPAVKPAVKAEQPKPKPKKRKRKKGKSKSKRGNVKQGRGWSAKQGKSKTRSKSNAKAHRGGK